MNSYDKIRSLYVEWSMRDNYTTQATKINALVDQQKRSAGAAWNVFQNMTGAMGEGFGNAGQFFALCDQQLKENIIRQQHHNQALGSAAAQYSHLKFQARLYAETTRTQIARATQFINEHQMALAATGTALTSLSYAGYRFYYDGTRDLGTYQDAYRTFTKNAGNDAENLMKRMRAAANGTITDTNLLIQANRALVLGIPYEKLPRFLETSRAAARAMGTDVQYMLESLVSGAGRASALLLDNLGLKMDELDEYERSWAESQGLSVKALTEEQKNLVFLNYIMDHSEDIISKADMSQRSLNETVQRSSATWQALHRELAGGAQPAIEGILDLVDGTTSALRDMPGPIKAVVGTGGLLATTIAGITGPLLLNAVALAYLSTNYGELVFMYGTLKSAAASYVASVFTRVIPAEVAQAYATGGLTAALYAGAAAGWAFVSPWLPWIALAGAVVGAGYLIWDLATRGWENSALKGIIDWLNQNVPWLTGSFEYLAGILGTVWGWITAIPDAVGSAWQGLTDHPLWKIAESVFRLTPIGMSFTAAELGANAAKDMLASTAVTTANTSTTVINTEYKVNVGDIRTEKLDEGQVEQIITTATKKASKHTERNLTRQIKGVSV